MRELVVVGALLLAARARAAVSAAGCARACARASPPSAAASSPPAAPEKVTLADAVRRALDRNPTVAVAPRRDRARRTR